MPSHTVPCRAVPCRAEQCHAVQCQAEPCQAVPCCAKLCHAMPCHAEQCHAVQCHAMPYQAVPYQAVPCRAKLCHAVPSGAKPCRSPPCHLHLSYRGQARHGADPAHQLLAQRHAAPGPGWCGAVSPPPAPGGGAADPKPPAAGLGRLPPAQPHPVQLRTTTTAAASRDFTEDRLWLNGEEVDAAQPRLQACLREGELFGEGGTERRPRAPPHPPDPILLQSGAWLANAAVTMTRPPSTSPTKSTSPPRTISPPPPGWRPRPPATPAWVGERGQRRHLVPLLPCRGMARRPR